MKATIRDIARETNLSLGTVSMALNDSDKIKEDTKRLIFDAVQRLDYNPSGRVHLVRRLKVKTLGIVTPAAVYTRNEFYNRAVNAFKAASAERGCDAMMYAEDELQERLPGTEGMAGGRVTCDGLVLFGPLRSWGGRIRMLRKQGIPVALIRRRSRIPGVIRIADDDAQGTRLALEHLHAMGHTHIGYVGRDIVRGKTGVRKRTYDRFMADAGQAHRSLPVLDMGHGDGSGVDKYLSAHLSGYKRMTAVFCDSDRAAALVIRAVHRLGMRVPDDLAVVGYNDDYLAEIYNPGITTVHVPVEKMVGAACTALMDALEGRADENTMLRFDNRLVVRESCGMRRRSP